MPMSTSPPNSSARLPNDCPQPPTQQHPGARQEERRRSDDCAGYEYRLLQKDDHHPGGSCVDAGGDRNPGKRPAYDDRNRGFDIEVR